MPADPRAVEASETKILHVYPPSVGLMMGLRALGNTMAESIEDPSAVDRVTQLDTLVFYWAMTTPPNVARRMLADAVRSGDLSGILAEAEELAWLLVPTVIAELNSAIEKTREQVQAVRVTIIPDPKNPSDSKN